jgi:hypothetical protein
MSRQMCTCRRNICPNTTGGLRARRPKPRIITAARRRVGEDLPAGERTHGQRRLGGALRQPVLPAPAAEPPLRAGARQSVGLRRGGRKHRDRVWGPRRAVAGDPATGEAACPGGHATWRAGSQPGHSGHADGEAEVGAASQPPMAAGRPRPTSFGFRPALRPKRSALRAPQGSAPAGTRKKHQQQQPNSFRGDTSNELRKGTFLKSFDMGSA